VRAACAAGALYVGQQRAVMVGHDTVVGVHWDHLQDFLEECSLSGGASMVAARPP